MLGLYLHIPFCQSICSYCNFNRGLYDAGAEGAVCDGARARDSRSRRRPRGRHGVLRRRHAVAARSRRSGTASRAPAASRTPSRPMRKSRSKPIPRRPRRHASRASATPASTGSASASSRSTTRSSGAWDASIQRDVPRRPSREAREAGLDNISLDLMLWLPGQSRASWRRTVARAIGLGPEHLSFYLLELYPNAPLKEAMARAQRTLPPAPHAPPVAPGSDWLQAEDDEAADMYLEGFGLAEAGGYEQYRNLQCRPPGACQPPQPEVLGRWAVAGIRLWSAFHGRRCPLA